MAKDKNEGVTNPIQPSGPSALQVALEGTVIGQSVDNFENLIINSMSQLIYGTNNGKSRFKLTDIASMAKKDYNPVALLDSINKKFENFQKASKKTNEQQIRIANNLGLISKTLTSFCEGTIKIFEEVKNAPAPSEGGGSVNTLQVILEGSNVDQVFHSLAEIANDNVVYKLGDAFQMLIENSANLNKFGEDIEIFTNQIEKLGNMSNNFDNTSSLIEMLSDKITSLETSLISLNPQNLESFVNSIQILANTNVENMNVEALKKILSDINEINVNVNKFSDVAAAISSLKAVNELNIENVTIQKIDSLNSILIELDDTIKFLNSIEDVKDKDKIENIAYVISKLSTVNVESFEWLNKIDKSLLKKIPNITKIIKPLSKLSKRLDKYKNIDLSKLTLVQNAISSLSRLKIEKINTDINEGAIIGISKSIKRIVKHLGKISHEISEFDFKDFNTNIAIIVDGLDKLSQLEFEGIGYVDIDELDDIINSDVLGKIVKLTQQIGKDKTEDIKYSVINAKHLRKFLGILEDLSYQPDGTVTAETIIKINFLIEKFIEIGKNINELGYFIDEDSLETIETLDEILHIIGNIKTKKFENKNFDAVLAATTSIANLSSSLENIDNNSSSKIASLNNFVQEMFGDDGVMETLVNQLEKVKIDDEQSKKLDIICNVIKKISKTAELVAIIGCLEPMITSGINVIEKFVDSIVTICNKLEGIDDKKLKSGMSVMHGIAKLVAISTICMIIGGAFIIFFPKLVVGALVFGLVLGIFIMTVLAGINIATSFGGGIKTAGETLAGVGKLILMATFAMILGGAFILFFPKMVVASIAFGLALGLFLFITLGAINLASRGLDVAEQSLKEIGKLIVMASFVMILGAVFMMIPGMWKNAFKFTLALGVFIFATLGAINLSTRSLRQSSRNIESLTKIVIISAFTMILGALFMMIPGMWTNSMLFAVTLGAFIAAVLYAINFGTRGIKKAKKNAEAFQLVVIVSAAALLIGGMLLMIYPDLQWTVPLFGGILLGFTLLMSLVMKVLSKTQKNIQKGAISMAILSGVMLVVASTMLIIKKATEGDLKSLLAGVGLMALIIIGAAGIAFGLGALLNGPGGVIFLIGVGGISLVIGVVMLASLALMSIAKAMDTLSKVKEFDAGPIVANLIALTSITGELAKFALLSFIIIPASLAIASLSICISSIAEAVQEAASLKIPIYQGTKKIGYRQLTNKDFKDAAKNIKTIVTILGKTIIDLYHKSPDMFSDPLIGNNPFTTVVKSTTGLAKLISKISHAVKDVADLKIPEYSGTNITGYRHLDKKDFEFASNNVKSIILALSLPLIKLYNDHQEMYKDHSIWTNKPGNTPLSMVISVSMRLGKLISKIASGVADMAELKIPTKYNDEGKAIEFRQMSDQEVVQAGINTKTIIETLSNSLISLYDAHPEMYKDPFWFSQKPGNTPLSMVISVSMKLGKLISRIASGVADMAKLKIAKTWNNEGKAIDFDPMTSEQIVQAGENTKSIIEILSNALIDIYNENTEMYKDNSLFSFISGSKPGNTPLSRVISVSMQLGKLISKIAGGVGDMAKLKIAKKWNNEGKAIDFDSMTSEQIIQAGKNTKDVVSILGNALMESYDQHHEWYDGDLDETPFYIVVSVNQKLGKLISNIAKGIGSLAKLQIAEEYDKNGKAIKYRQLNKTDFEMAGKNVGEIITVLGNAIMAQYDNHPKWFKDEDGDILKAEKSPFAIVMKATGEMGTLICNLSKGLKDYAKLQIPTKWDDKGKAIEYRQLTETDFTNAGTNIGKVITTIGDSIMKMYTEHEPWFKDEGKSKDSPFVKTLNSCVAMGDMIASISTGITALAQLMIPIDWDNTGKPIKFREMKETDFTMASNAIEKVVTTVGGALITLYENDAYGMFNSEEDEDTPFSKVAQGCAYLGEMIKNIAEGVVEMATLETTLAKEGIKIDANTYKAAGENISNVVSAIGNALMTTFKDHKDWFENPPLVKGNWFSSEEVPNDGDTPFQKIMQSSMLMGQLIMSVAQAVSFFAIMTQSPVEVNGEKLTIDIDKASTNIKTVLCAIGQSIVETASSDSFVDPEKIETIMRSIIKSTVAVNNIANLIAKIGTGKITTLDKNGNIIKEIDINDTTLKNSAEFISDILTAVSIGLTDASKVASKYEFNPFAEVTSTIKLDKTLDLINKAINVIGTNANMLALLSKYKMTFTNAKGEVESVNVTPADMKNGADVITSVLENVAKGLSNAYDSFTLIFNFNKMEKMVDIIGKAMKMVSDNALLLRNLAAEQFPIYDKDMKLVECIAITQDNFEKGGTVIGNVIKNIAEGLKTGTESVEDLFNNYTDFKDTKVSKMLDGVKKGADVVGNMAYFLANLANCRYEFIRNGKLTHIEFNPIMFVLAGHFISSIISSVASGIGFGTKSVEKLFNNSTKFKDSKVAKMLTAVEEAKNVVGRMAFFLANLANNEFVYFDARKNEVKSIQFDSSEKLVNAADTISLIISSISEGIGKGIDAIEKTHGNTFSGEFEKSKAYKLLTSLSMSKDAVGPITLFVSRLAQGQYTYFENGQEKTVEFITDKSKITKVTEAINTILTSLAKTIADAANTLDELGFSVLGIGIGTSSSDKISLMFRSINKAVAMLGDVAQIVSYYSKGEIVSVKTDPNGGMNIQRSGAPNVETAKTNIKGIIDGIVDVIKSSSESINEINNVDETFNNLNKSLRIVNVATQTVEMIAKSKSSVLELEGFSFGTIMSPIIADISNVFDSMNNIGNAQQGINGIFNNAIETLTGQKTSSSPIQMFLNDVDSMVVQAYAIAMAPMEQSYNTLNKAITTTMETINNVQMPENFGKQVDDLSKFIQSVNSIRIDGVDSLTALLKELNKMGINMGNLDKLTSAIANKLTVALQQCQAVMKELNKTMRDDWKRKDKHKGEIKSSVEEIQKIMSKTMEVVVKMDESSTPGSNLGGNENPNDDQNDRNNTNGGNGGVPTQGGR